MLFYFPKKKILIFFSTGLEAFLHRHIKSNSESFSNPDMMCNKDEIIPWEF
jgi:hypothetical protein